MVENRTLVINEHGLHARPASDFVQAAGKFKSNVEIARVDDPENFSSAKSIMGVLLCGLCKGDEVIVRANGEDEQEAVDSLIALINSGFGE